MEYLNKNTFRVNLMTNSVLHQSEFIKVQIQLILSFRYKRKDNHTQQNVGNEAFREENVYFKAFHFILILPYRQKNKTHVPEKQLD